MRSLGSASHAGWGETLGGWQKRLEAHFAALAEARRANGLPVFAIEHGLNADERSIVGKLLNRSLGSEEAGQSWLVWVIYAAEQGYEYDGDEYWTTFERRTPEWRNFVDRRQLRRWFGRFHKKYAGLRPTGAWASWFSIIAWPITHALLPRDLQSHLARALYHWRYPLAKMLGDDPARIGRFLAGVSHDAPSRFRNFLEQEEIAGRIVLALLVGRTEAVAQFVLPVTLERIVADLQKASAARAWLRDARQVVERYQLKGTARQISGSSGNASAPRIAVAAAQPYIRPALTLRRAAPGEWKPWIELPSLRPIADLSPEFGAYLRRARCSVGGSPGLMPPGWLMLGDQRRLLASWPAADRPIVQFSDPPPMLAQLLAADGCITTGPIWLFRVGADGLARQVIGRMVRPGQSYVLVSDAPIATGQIGAPVTVVVTGATAIGFDLPPHLSEDAITTLRAMGLGVGQSIRIAPAGLEARRWDGEGFAEWTEGENPCLSLEADHSVRAYAVQFDGGAVLEVPANGGSPIFLKLTDLDVGPHTLSVEARSQIGDAPKAAAGYIALTVRPPEPWIAGTTNHSGLAITAEPAEPSLDQFWKGEVNIQALGPAQQQVRICVELLDAAGSILATEQVAALPLPITRETWVRALSGFLKRETDPWAYLTATSGRLVIDGDASGCWRMPLHREVAPLRWVWHRGANRTALRLIDDHGGNDPVVAQLFSFARPASAIELNAKDLEADFYPSEQGGLCVASYGNRTEALVVSMPQTLGSLSGLVIAPEIAVNTGSEDPIGQLSALMELWRGAKLVGPLVASRQQAVIKTFERRLAALLFGADWAAAEARYSQSQKGPKDLKDLGSQMGAPPAFNFVIARDIEKFRSMPLAKRIAEVEALAQRYSTVPHGAAAASFAIAGWLDEGGPWTDGLTAHLSALRAVPFMLRAARLLSIATPAGSQLDSGEHDRQ
ncbi:hypothetical protein FHT36_001582 [Xanthobacter sp. SG618]|uniref:hypothetical protein n=1 Tax=Xanthobacter sp. SG618 TaxID=2587121 RepID=UPI00145D3342|nr:hypothetical protein [Xanthobacter sp. SG618]NMN57685.1 hypothetical protein [Xanthobacter sp. SG618]